MLVIPAVDLKGGRCVRLLQGKASAETVFSDDPVAMAERWETEGAPRLHVVDLDGASCGHLIMSRPCSRPARAGLSSAPARRSTPLFSPRCAGASRIASSSAWT